MSNKCDEWYQRDREERGETVEPGTRRKRKSNPKYSNNNSDDEGGNNNKPPTKQSRTESNSNVAASAPSPSNATTVPPSQPQSSPPTVTGDTAAAPSPSKSPSSTTGTNMSCSSNSASAIEISTTSPSPLPDDEVKKGNDAVKKGEGEEGAPVTDHAFVPTNMKMWPFASEITDHCHADLSIDGLSIQCLRCRGKGKSKGIIQMRHAYRTSAWEEHCRSRGHINSVADYEAIRANKKDIHNKKQGQTNMLKFFTKKKKSTDAAATTSNPVPTNDVINVDEEEDKKSRIPMRFDGCAGVYNSFAGPKMKEVSLYAQYISPPSHQRWVVSSYGGLPSIVSRECTNKGILLSKNNEGLVCVSCNDLRIARGCSNPSVTLDKWYADLDRCLDRRNRQVITARDNADALLFTKKTQSEFTPAGIELMEEAKALVET